MKFLCKFIHAVEFWLFRMEIQDLEVETLGWQEKTSLTMRQSPSENQKQHRKSETVY